MTFNCPNCHYEIDPDKVHCEYHPKNECREFAKCPSCKKWIEFNNDGPVGEY